MTHLDELKREYERGFKDGHKYGAGAGAHELQRSER